MRNLLTLLVLLLTQPAFAGSATVNYNSSGSSSFRTTTDSSSNNLSNVTIWDSSAGANGLAINGSGQAAIQAPPTLPLPSGAATSALQTTIITTLGSPFQAGGNVGNTGFNALQGGAANSTSNPFYFLFGTGATLPAFASTPTVNLGTIGSAATAANQTNVQGAVGTPAATAVTIQGNASGTPVPVTGTFSANLGSFQPAASSATLSVSSTSARVALPTNTGTVIVYNTGSQIVSTTLGNSSVTVTATGGDQIEPGCWIGYNPSGSQTNIAGVTATGTSSLVITGGVGLPTGGCSSSFSGTIGTVNQGSAGASPWLVTGSGTAGTAASGVVTVQGIASMTPVQVSQATAASLNATVVGTGTFAVQAAQTGSWTVTANAGTGNFSTNMVQIGGTSVVGGGVGGSLGIGGLAASGASVSGNPVLAGGRAENAEPTAVTNGQVVTSARDLVGRDITFPYANKENLVEGTANVTGTTSTSLIAAPGSGLYVYVTAISCFNSGSTGTTVSFQNGSAGTTLWEGYAAPSGGGFTHSFVTPIGGVNNMTANTALYFQAGSSTTTLYCNASGFKGS